jgi:hypothetical protein
MDYTAALAKLDAWSKDIEGFARHVSRNKRNNVDAANDMLLMIELYNGYMRQLHNEATVCRQRKRVTLRFQKLYNRANEYREVVESNRVMYSLMFA